MRIVIAAVGRLKDEAERRLFARYADGFAASGRGVALGPLELVEIPESRAATAALRKRDEAHELLRHLRTPAEIAALDIQGQTLTSEDFARWLGGRRDAGVRTLAFLIGGPDGHGEAVLEAAVRRLSLSRLTFTHGLARIVLAEQLYRAAAILAGHPYHRG